MNAVDIITRIETDMLSLKTHIDGKNKTFIYMTYEILMNSEGQPKPIRRFSINDCVLESIDYYKPEQVVDFVKTRKCKELIRWLETYMIEMSLYRDTLGKHFKMMFEPLDYDMDSPPIISVWGESVEDIVKRALLTQIHFMSSQNIEVEEDIVKMFKAM